jgi:galactokinase
VHIIRQAGISMRSNPGSALDLPPALVAQLPADAEIVTQAPGRANLIGEHTDYNGGFVLPVALELRTVVAGRRADRIRLRSVGHEGTVEIDSSTGGGPMAGWGRYVTAVLAALRNDGRRLRGIDGVIASDVPSGTGLSSSAALEVALALALLDEPIEPLELALLCQRAENIGVGVQSGIMDPLASAAARAGSALFVDCTTFETSQVPMAAELRLLVIDSGRRRELSDGDYNLRRAECEEAARLLGAASLREVSAEDVDSAGLPEPLASRARHVISENARTLAAVEAFRTDDRRAIGDLFAASHASLAGDFAVSTPELDALVEIATGVDGVIGARMTGAGFGGCTVNLVRADHAAAAARQIIGRYGKRSGRNARAWISAAASGAFELGLSTMQA